MKQLIASSLNKARQIYTKYLEDKQQIQNRIIQNEKFYNSQNWDKSDTPKSAWLLNVLMNKHADAMDNYPQATVLPRMQDDVQQANMLSKLLPIILRQNRYEGLYSDSWWSKLKTGTSVQGVFWSPNEKDKTGDIIIKNIDVLNLYFEKGINDIQNSPNIFYTSLINKDELSAKYGINNVDDDMYAKNDKDKCEIIDWYYKAYNSKGKAIVHYCKFCGNTIIYASQNDSNLSEKGFYNHSKYPFVVDRLFSLNNSPFGFGYIDILMDTQKYIDEINVSILNHAKLASKKRFFVRFDGGINESEFADFNRSFVNVAGPLNEESIREINLNPLDESCFRILGIKIDELKEVSGNRDFNQGATMGGITAASAIAALQEAGNKLSRDMIKSAYRAFTDVCSLVIELVRQFYNTPRTMNIIDENGICFESFSNENMQFLDGQYRLPEYDIVIQAQKSNPFSTLAQNELAKEFYNMGFFEPQNAQSALHCIAMMSFDGKDELMLKLKKLAEGYNA